VELAHPCIVEKRNREKKKRHALAPFRQDEFLAKFRVTGKIVNRCVLIGVAPIEQKPAIPADA
jgi:hypothetical protein